MRIAYNFRKIYFPVFVLFVSINVFGQPIANDDDYPAAVSEGGSNLIPPDGVLANDIDQDATGSMFAILNTTTSFGSLSLQPDGSFSYTHDGSEQFTDSFTYFVQDGNNSTSSLATVTIHITPVNEAPTDIILSATSIAENQATNTVVGSLSSIDPDGDVSFTYSLVSGTGGADNSSFNISGTNLRISSGFDFEVKSSYAIRIRTTDGGGLSFEKPYTITVTNVNEAPTDISLSATSIAENQATNTVVGSLSSSDPDGDVSFTYSLVSGTGGADNSSFNISGTNLRISSSFNFEVKSSYSIRIRTTDGGGLSFEKPYVITVTNINETPTASAISVSSVPENMAINTIVGNFTTTDPDVTDVSFTYTLVVGTGSTDNSSFNISGDNLRTSAVFDFETKSSYAIRIRTTDAGGLFFERSFTITVTSGNDAPTDMALSASNLSENLPVNTVIGALTTSDPDGDLVFTYSKVSGAGDADNGSFNISGVQLRASEIFDFETQTSYNIRLRTTDGGGLSFEKAFVISIDNVNEAPVLSAIEGSVLPFTEGEAAKTITGSLVVDDPDNSNISSAAITISAGKVSSEDVLSLVSTPPLAISFNSGTGVLTLTGSATRAFYQAALRNVKYQNTNTNNPNANQRTISFAISDGSLSSNIQTRNIQITTVNSAPDLITLEAGLLNYTEDSPAAQVTNTITIQDVDNNNIVSATVNISQNFIVSEDSLLYSSASGVVVVYTPSTGTIQANGTASKAIYQSFLRSIEYKNFNHANPSLLQRRIQFVVSDSSVASSPVNRRIQMVRVNDVPLATLAAIQGTNYYVNDFLTANYTYTDPDGDAEAGTTFQWYSATSAAGAGRAAIVGAIADTHTVTFADGGKYIQFIVRPYDATGPGVRDTSAWHYMNAAPVFQNFEAVNILHPGAFALGETVSASYTYFDKEPDPAGIHTFQWYRSTSGTWTGATTIPAATTQNYTLVFADTGKYIALEGRPYATAGSSPGNKYRTDWYPVSETPSAIISGNDSICNSTGTKGRLSVILSGSNPPWSFSYKINNGPTKIKSNIPADSANYVFFVTDTGRYTLVSVSDAEFDFGITAGSAHLAYYKKPTAVFPNATYTICSADAGIHYLPVNLTGKAPWSITYLRNGSGATPINGILTDTASIPVSSTLLGTYTISNVTDAHCSSTGTGNSVVSQKTNPIAMISGSKTVCPGGVAKLPVNLTGNGPWNYKYSRNGGAEINVFIDQNVNSFSDTITTSNPGTYRLTRVVDETLIEGCVSGSAIVANYTVPTATVPAGTVEFCEGTSATVNVNLTGVSPWVLSYQRDAELPVSLGTTNQNPYPLQIIDSGSYRIHSVADAHCSGTTSGNAMAEMILAPIVDIIGLKNKYSVETSVDTFDVIPLGGEVNSPTAALFPLGNSYRFSPFLSGLGEHDITYSLMDNNTSCIGSKTITIDVIDAKGAIFPDAVLSQMICYNIEPFIIRASFFGEPDPGTFSVDAGNVGLTTISDTSALFNPSLLAAGVHLLEYKFKQDGLPKTIKKIIEIEKITANFSWDNECFDTQSTIAFKNLSTTTSSPIDQYFWQISLANSVLQSSEAEPTFVFSNLDTYPIELVVIDTNNCSDTILRDLILKPTYTVDALPYSTDFSEGESFWNSNTASDNTFNSWKFGKPNSDLLNAANNEKAWYTNITNSIDSVKAEQSYVIGPCFDFSDSKRPMVKMNICRGLTPNIDGAVLQYTLNNGENWLNVGDIGDGIEWYNSYTIPGAPGNQGIGWTDASDNKWVECRHGLDDLVGKSNVRFRMAYGATGADVNRNGLAFDDVWIGERTKKVLIEHFTNASDEDCEIANMSLNSLANLNGSDIIDVQYHMAYPGDDSFYDAYSIISDNRDLYYHIIDVPYTIMDGGRGIGNSEYTYSYPIMPKQLDFTLGALADNKFDIELLTDIVGDEVTISVTITANEAFDVQQMTINILAVEHLINGVVAGTNGESRFESVIKDAIPGSSGTLYDRAWTIGSTEYINFTWPVNNIINNKELRIVAYLQDELTQEVYQAEISDPNIDLTGLPENMSQKGKSILVFPNPASAMSSVYFSEPLSNDTKVKLFDETGRLVNSYSLPEGLQEFTFSIEGYRAGVYVLKVTNTEKEIGSDKLIIINNQ